MITSRSLIASGGAAVAAIAAMAWLSFARGGTPEPQAQASAMDVVLGRALFERLWVAAPASTDAADGLGPLFNARSCAACHKEGRSARLVTYSGATEVRGLVVRVAAESGAPHPELGVQLQDRALPGLPAEAHIEPRIENGALTVVTALHRQPASPAVLDTRLAPSLRGRALLEQIDESAILALADPDDRDGDGISGRPHMISDKSGNMLLGRYGSKAMVASLAMQTAEAAALDIGLSSPLVPHPFGDCTALQSDCTARPTGRSAISEGEEVSSEVIGLIVSFLRSLDPPVADTGSEGFRLFVSTGCAACHVPLLPARDGTMKQVFTDLLLHDLGPEGASSISEGDAEPAEWRTAPLRDLDPRGG